MTKEGSTQKEIAEARERARGYALKNLKAPNLVNLAVAYHAQGKDSGFGDADNDSVEQYLYKPSLKGSNAFDLKTGRESDLVYDSLMGSRQDGKRYSGQFSEYGIIQTSASIVQESLLAVTVSDIMGLIGSKVPIKKEYENRYVTDLVASGNKEDNEVAQTIVNAYLTYMTTTGVSASLGMRAKDIKGGLEKLVGAEDKGKKGK